jgi:hypothetical protein
MSYTDVFSGDPVFPADLGYRAVTLAANTTLAWPTFAQASDDVVTDIMDVSASSGSLALTMPSALLASPGLAVFIRNTGANTFSVKDNSGVEIASIASSVCWMIYLKTNATAAGTWGAIQFGAATSTAQAGDLDGAGLVALNGQLALKFEASRFSTDYTAGSGDRAQHLLWTGGSGTLTLPSVNTLTDSWFCIVKNGGSGTLTIAPASDTIDGAASIALAPTESCFVLNDTGDWQTVGRGRSVTSFMSYMTINVAGSGDYTLSSAQQDQIIYRFTGILTGNRNIIVPASVQQYWVRNDTTGSYTLTVKTAAGSGTEVTQGQSAILYCNGSDVVGAAQGSLTLPLTIANGGTGATSASAARTALGATSVGAAVFTAANEAAGRTALGITLTDYTEKLSAGRTYYVRADGNDSNTGLANTSGGAFLTLQKALETAGALNANGYGITISVGAGTFVGGTVRAMGGQADYQTLVIAGAGATTIFSSEILVSRRCAVRLQDMKFTSSGNAIVANGGQVYLTGGIEFGACPGYHMYAAYGGMIVNTGYNYTISAASARHMYALYHGLIECQSGTVTITGTPGFSIFAAAELRGTIRATTMTYSGAATGSRYYAEYRGYIVTAGGGASYFPGNTGGSTGGSGIYE